MLSTNVFFMVLFRDMTRKSLKPTSTVASGRRLINSVYHLKLPAKRVLLMCLTELNKRPAAEKDNPTFIVTAAEYREIFGVHETNARRELLAATKELSQVIPIKGEDLAVREVSWLHAKEHDGKGKANALYRLTFHSDIFPLLRDLSKGFAKFRIGDVKSLSSVNQIRLYEDLTLNRNGQIWTQTLSQFGERYDFGKSTLSKPAMFRNKFLIAAIKTINESTPLTVTYDNNGHEFQFHIKSENDSNE